MRKNLLLLFLCGSALLHGQFVAPYYDLTGQMYVFDNGTTHFVESLPPTSVKAGRNYLAYVNQNNSRLRIYYGGKTYTVCENAADYFSTDNWFVYKNYSNLGVLYNNKIMSLEALAGDEYWYADSIIVWYSSMNEVKAFWNGQTIRLEQFPIKQMTDAAVSNAKIGDNIFAYIDQSGALKAYYHGELKVLESYEPTTFLVNRDLVSYIDNTGNWKFFCNGKFYETTINSITNYWTGESFFAYYTLGGQLAVWYNGEEKIISQDRPKDLQIGQNVIAYTDNGNNFYVWYQGKQALLDRYQPQQVKTYRNLVAYQDQYGRLKGYYYGRPVEISDQIVNSFEMHLETIVFSLVRGEVRIWAGDKLYYYEQ